jgi:hypothetical protein
VEVVDSLFVPDPAMRLTKTSSQSNVFLQNSVKAGLAASVGLFGIEGSVSTMSEAERNGTNANINVFNTTGNLLTPTPSTVSHSDSANNSTCNTPNLTESGGVDTTERMSLKEFTRVAELDPDLYRCFGIFRLHSRSFHLYVKVNFRIAGMFDYFYYTVVRPIETTLKTDVVKPGMQGHLLYHKNVKMLGGLINKVPT